MYGSVHRPTRLAGQAQAGAVARPATHDRHTTRQLDHHSISEAELLAALATRLQGPCRRRAVPLQDEASCVRTGETDSSSAKGMPPDQDCGARGAKPSAGPRRSRLTLQDEISRRLSLETSPFDALVVGKLAKTVPNFVDERAHTGPAQPPQQLRVGEFGTSGRRRLRLQRGEDQTREEV